MKKIIGFLLLFTWICGYSQISYTDSTRHITVNGYTGILSYGGISTVNAKVRGYVTARMGGDVKYSPRSFFTLSALGAVEVNETATVSPFYLMGMKFSHKKFSLTLGKIATPMTELRPLPTTGAGQFESWTQSKILGSGYGGKITYTPNSKITLVTGGFWRGNDATVELGIKIPYVRIAGYYAVQTKNFGVAMTIDYKILTTVISYNHKSNAGMFNCITIPKTRGLMICSDIGFNPLTGTMLRGEWGPFIPLNIWKIGILFGTTYNHISREVRGYFYIHI